MWTWGVGGFWLSFGCSGSSGHYNLYLLEKLVSFIYSDYEDHGKLVIFAIIFLIPLHFPRSQGSFFGGCQGEGRGRRGGANLVRGSFGRP